MSFLVRKQALHDKRQGGEGRFLEPIDDCGFVSDIAGDDGRYAALEFAKI